MVPGGERGPGAVTTAFVKVARQARRPCLEMSRQEAEHVVRGQNRRAGRDRRLS